MKPPITLAVLLILAVSSPGAHALGVGNAQVGSALNAPLNASIPLVDAEQYSSQALSVKLAERSAYTSAGLEWSDVIANVSATLQGQPPTIRLTSSQPVDEPWLDLLLVIESPEGSHAHEITLLFDPVDYASNAQVSEPAQPQSVSQNQFQNQSPTQTQTPRSADAQSRSNISRNQVNAGIQNPAYVNNGDTLWSVAERLKPAQASVQQMMVALLEANPEVFPSGNINAMRAGFTLNVPSETQVMRRSADASAETIEAMNAAWRNRGNRLASVALPEPETAAELEEETPADSQSQGEASDTAPSIDAAAIVSAEAVNPVDETDTLVEQLEESQAMLAELIEEREQMRSELDALRSEVTELTQALASQERVAPASDVVQEQETARTDDSASSAVERGFPSLTTLMENYRWTLIAAGLGLLLVLLLLIRRRQAKEWEDVDQVTISEPSVVPNKQASAQKATQGSAPKQETSNAQKPQTPSFSAVEEELETGSFETDPFTEPSPTIYAAQEVYAKSTDSEAPELEEAKREEAKREEDKLEEIEFEGAEPESSNPEPDELEMQESLEMEEPLEWEADDDDVLGRSQAAGLASQRSAASQKSPETEDAPEAEREPETEQEFELEKEPEQEPELETEPDTGPKTEASPKPPEVSSSEQDTQQDSRFIDYQPPSLSAEPAAPREETPMQPTVEFEPVETDESQGAKEVDEGEKKDESPADNVADERQKTTKTDNDSPLGEGWEIEEVAFKVPGRDNTRSS
ncbi:FimV/HubP family polar landmark protein [Halomonas vilamensis]|uniref:FimV/HubP family polar landmark protein n=1 Tax=Vreelandella vilamensis TaxID=531309 RepID=A0ABU1H7F5_9GAMM|nr:FimV/HubP family polar landmark protein [Halomonas vilamensis]MDR5900233.1 FimV/HubP family polar landmark protein [Halomonas vilamensis]